MEAYWTLFFWGGGIPVLTAVGEFVKSFVPPGSTVNPWIVRVVVLVAGLGIGAISGLKCGYSIEDGLLSGLLQVFGALGLYHWAGWNRNKKV